jgi:hypothetical protein
VLNDENWKNVLETIQKKVRREIRSQQNERQENHPSRPRRAIIAAWGEN